MTKTKQQLCFLISIYHFSDDNDKLLTIERWQVDCIVWMNLIHDTIRHDINFRWEWRLSHHLSLLRQKSRASSVSGLRGIVSRNIQSIILQVHKPSHNHTVKIMYTKTNKNKMQGVKFSQNKHCPVYETEQLVLVYLFLWISFNLMKKRIHKRQPIKI